MLKGSESQQVVGLELMPGCPINGYFAASLGEEGYVPAHDIPFNELVFFDGFFDRPPMIWYPSTDTVGNTVVRSPNGQGFGTFESRRNTARDVHRNDLPGILLARTTFTGLITRMPITNAEISRKLNFTMMEVTDVAAGRGNPPILRYRTVPTMVRGPWFLGSDARTYQVMDPCDVQFGFDHYQWTNDLIEEEYLTYAMLYFFEAQKASTAAVVKKPYFFLNQVTNNNLPLGMKSDEGLLDYQERLHSRLNIPGSPKRPTCFVTFDMTFGSDGLPRLSSNALFASGYSGPNSVSVTSTTSDILKSFKTFTAGKNASWPAGTLVPLPAVRVLHPDGYDVPFPTGGSTSPIQIADGLGGDEN